MGWHSRSELGEFRRPVLVGYVTRLETLLIILLFSVLFWVCSLWLRLPFFSVRSIMLWIISVTLFMNYGFVIIDYTARGLDKLPALSGELVFPTHDTRLFRVIGLSLVFFGIHESLEDQSARQAFVMASFFVYPIFFAVMIVSRNAGQLLNPVTLFGVLVNFSRSRAALTYYGLLAAVAIWLNWITLNFMSVSVFAYSWIVPLTLSLLILLFRALGIAINTRAEELGLPVLENEATWSRRQARHRSDEISDHLKSVYGLIQVHKYQEAWQQLDEILRRRHYADEDEYFHRLCQWDDKALALKLGQTFIDRLLKAEEMDRVVRVCQQCLDMAGSRFRFSSGSALLRMFEAETTRSLRLRLMEILQQFETDYPQHPQTTTALLRLAKVQLADAGDVNAARGTLRRALERDPDLKQSPVFVKLLREIKDHDQGSHSA